MKGTVSINLASEPFRRDRPFIAAALAGCALLGGLLVWQLAAAWVERDQRAELQKSVDAANRRLQQINTEAAKVDATLRQPEYADVYDYAVFLNGLIQRKSIAWTRIFSDLEKVMPHNVRLISVRPQVSLENQIQLDMMVGTQTPEPFVNMVMKLEGSELFGKTTVPSWLPPSQSDPMYRYRVNVSYSPRF